MRIAESHSHFGGLEFLFTHQPDMLREVERVVDAVNAESRRKSVVRLAGKQSQLLYSSLELEHDFEMLFREHGWRTAWSVKYIAPSDPLFRKTLTPQPDAKQFVVDQEGDLPVFGDNENNYFKSRIAIDVRFGKRGFIAYDLFARHLALYIGDHIDVGIEILPMKSLQSQMSSGVSYYEGELYNVIRQGRGVPAVPLVIVGVEP